MKTDAELRSDVMAELAWDPAIRAAGVGVAVRDGVVTLSGHLETFAEKVAIEHAVQRVHGVRAVALELDVRLAPQHRRSDTEIAAVAEQALKWHTEVPADRLRITVDGGWITLQGEVDWEFQRRAAFKAVRPLVGVVGVSNEILLTPRLAPADLDARIAEALKRRALREARRIDVKVDDGTVTLRGEVPTWQERDAAQGAVWSAPGVRRVVNELRVAAA